MYPFPSSHSLFLDYDSISAARFVLHIQSHVLDIIL